MLSMTVCFAAEEPNIEEAIAELDLYLQSLNVLPEHLFQIHTCCREALNNIVEHGDCRQSRSPLMFSLSIEICKRRDERIATIQITDNGEAFEPPESAIGGPQNLALSGRGWTILRQWSDTLTFGRTDGLNRLTFTKQLTWRAN